jgi:hypothetical protein
LEVRIAYTFQLTISDETYKIFGFENTLKPSLERVMSRTHPEDKELVRQFLQRVSGEEESFDTELRLLMPDDEVKYIHVVARVMKNASGVTECIGAVTEVHVHLMVFNNPTV